MSFREMKHANQQLSNEEAIAILQRGKSGVLALHGDNGYPYAVPISYVYHEGKIILHGAPAGHKHELLARDNHVRHGTHRYRPCRKTGCARSRGAQILS